MTAASLLLLFLGAAGIGLTLFLYHRVEIPVPGRRLLLALRLTALVLLVLLLVNPPLPGTARPDRSARPGPWVLLDPDLSLAARDDSGASLWRVAVDRAVEEARRGAPLAVLGPPGAGPEGLDTLTLRRRGPAHPTGDLLEAIRRLAEAGADTVRVLGTFRRPPQLLERLREGSPVPLLLERVGGPVRNAGIGELELPERVRVGEEVEGRVTVFGEGGQAGDSVEVEVRMGEELVEAFRIPLPEPGTEVSRELRLPAPADTGGVRYRARVRLEGDRFGPDDERVRRVRVGEPEGGVFLLSLAPDWEPRTLLPMLEAATGLEGEGFLRIAEAGYLPLVGQEEGIRPVEAGSVQDRLERARLLVLHGAAAPIPPWVAEAAAAHPRVLHLPGGPSGAGLSGVDAGAPRPGEWAVDPDLPPTPVSPFLSGLPLGGLPPLSQLLPLTASPAGTVALRARDPGGGESVPLILLTEASEGRRVVVLGQGFWRWGAREGDPRRAYRSLWAGVADWLLARSGVAERGGVRPAGAVQPRGRALEWIVGPEHAGASLSLLPEGDGEMEPIFRGTLEPDEAGRVFTPSLPPGIYRYRAEPGGEETDGAPISDGTVEVDGWAPSLRRLPLEIPAAVAAAEARPRLGGGEGRPFRTHPLPYVLILLLLCGEWVGRRKVGLR